MNYPTDLTDKEWDLIKGYFEQKRVFGRPLTYERRYMVNAILYLTKSGCQWRMLPLEYPPWTTVYAYFRKWSDEGIWEKVLDTVNQKHRKRQGKAPDPTYGIIDSQSSKTEVSR